MLHGLRIADCIPHGVVTAFERRARLRPEGSPDLKRFAQSANAMSQARDGKHLVFHLRPGGADTKLEPPTRQVVHTGRNLGLQRRVAVGVASDHAPQPHVLRRTRHRRLERPTLVHWPIWSVGSDRRQMIEDPHVIEPRLVSDPPYRPQLVNGGVLAAVLYSKAQRMSHVTCTLREEHLAGFMETVLSQGCLATAVLDACPPQPGLDHRCDRSCAPANGRA